MKNKTKMLIVDDEPINMFVFQDIFDKNESYLCKYADNGEKALDIFHTFIPDIVLLDIMLPGIDGYEVCKRIRQNPKHKFVKIIMISGKAMLEERLKGYDTGADDYLIKPFDKDELLAKVKVFSRLKYIEEVETKQSGLLTLLSHETKTPMSGIIGAVELLKAEDLDPNHKDLLNIVHDSTRQLLQFIEKISLYYRLTQENNMQFDPVNIVLLIDNVLDDCKVSISQKNLKINWQKSKSLNTVGDFYFLQVAFKNIIDNAIKYSNHDDEVKIELFQEQNFLIIIISDNGPGIPIESQSEIFSAFSIKDIRHHHKGLGLSLATSQQIISMHNGYIELVNLEDNGASFCIKLPITNE